MKQAAYKTDFRFLKPGLTFVLLLFMALPTTWAQNDSNAAAPADSNATVVKEDTTKESSLISPSLLFLGVQKGDNSIDLKATLQTKVKGMFVKLYNMKVSFFQTRDTEERNLGHVITNGQGKALLNIKGDSLLAPDASGKLYFKAVFAGNPAMEAAEEVTEFKRAKLVIEPVKEDSAMSVQIKLVELGSGKEVPVPEVVVGVYVKRFINPLKIGEGTTDENGEALVDFPANLPGDSAGNLTVIAKLDENEIYGNLESVAAAPKWGKAVSAKSGDQPRALWSSHPPLWMLITFIVLMVVVWGHYLVIVWELFRLRKEEPPVATHATSQ